MEIFANSETIISDVINRLLNCRQLTQLYTWGKFTGELDYLYPTINLNVWNESGEGDVIYLRVESIEDVKEVEQWIYQYRKKKDFIVYIPNYLEEIRDRLSLCGIAYPLNEISSLNGYLLLIGVTFDSKEEWIPNDEFKVLAILHFYNEADILDRTIEYLLGQEVDIYLLDNWSDDGSYEKACNWRDKYPKNVYLERFPHSGKNENFELHEQMKKTEEICTATQYNWYIHYDADEIRVSPWKNISLKQALYWIECLGYNCVENTVIDFKLTDTAQNDIFMKDTYFDFRHEFCWYNHLKTWKKTDEINLKSNGGHTVKFKNPKPFPLKFLNKHYPLRSVEQATKKIFKDRIPRFAKEKQVYGWHGHYDKYLKDVRLLNDNKELLLWDRSTFERLYPALFMECGLRWELDTLQVDMPDIKGKKIVVYGAGNIGKKMFLELAKKNTVLAWSDEKALCLPWMYGMPIIERKCLQGIEFEYILILIENKRVQKQVVDVLLELGISESKIIGL